MSDKIIKTTVGFVSQIFTKDEDGKLTPFCQDFVAGDDVSYEDEEGNDISTDDTDLDLEEAYLPFHMVQPEDAEEVEPIDDKDIKDLYDRFNKLPDNKVVIGVRGGVADVDSKPDDIEVNIRDYDTEGSEEDITELDEHGNRYRLGIYE